MSRNSGLSEAPPTKNPSMSSHADSSGAFLAFAEQPYWMRTSAAVFSSDTRVSSVGVNVASNFSEGGLAFGGLICAWNVEEPDSFPHWLDPELNRCWRSPSRSHRFKSRGDPLPDSFLFLACSGLVVTRACPDRLVGDDNARLVLEGLEDRHNVRELLDAFGEHCFDALFTNGQGLADAEDAHEALFKDVGELGGHERVALLGRGKAELTAALRVANQHLSPMSFIWSTAISPV
eukprot:Tamp_17748.p1 GENE.Tamp_17748~~Tamp_17748.p1  ORF type:complete len:234 (+),score=17.94 Tamp_17748:140-841(+)